MDLGNSIIALILLAIFIVPIALLHLRRTNKEKKKLQSLREIAAQHNCSISKYEFCGDFVLGMDDKRNFVFFFKKKKEETTSKYINLAEVKTCQLVRKIRNVKINKDNEVVIERIELSFISSNKNNSETSFELFDETVNIQLSGELQFAEKWSKEINEVLKTNKKKG